MKKKRQQVNQAEAKGNSAGVLKKKARIYSTEAAAISIGIHLLLVLLAGSWIAVRYVQKHKAELTVYQAPPKMERRQLSAPAKMERIRQTSQRPKIVSSRMAASDSEFSLPALSGVAKASTQKFNSPFVESKREFSVLTKGITFRLPNFTFLGVRSHSEKVIFIIDDSRAMLSESSGGEAACAYIKQELNTVLSELPSSVLFNVILHNGETVATFQPKMIPVTEESRRELQEWLAPVLSQRSPEGLAPAQNTYEPQVSYETALGDEAKSWARAMQAAMEQRPDTVFVVGRDWGRHAISREKGRHLMEFSLWQSLGGSGKRSFAGSKALIDDREMRDKLVVSAVEAIKDEEKLDRLEKYPDQFLHDLVYYMQYSPDQVMAHIGVVCRSNYRSVQQDPPLINYIRIVADADVGLSDSSTQNIRKFVRDYKGEFKFLNGKNLQKKMRGEAAVAVAPAAGEGCGYESTVEFFGAAVKSSRVAFVLDVSEKMFAEETGGEPAFNSIKMQIARMVTSLDPGTPFNILAAGEERVVAFSSQMTTSAVPQAVESWLAAVQRGLTLTNLTEQQIINVPATVYRTAIGEDIKGLPLALQVAMEQRADTILVAGAGISQLPVDREKARRLLNFSILNTLGPAGADPTSKADKADVADLSEEASNGILRPLKKDQEQWQQVMRHAFDRMKAENEKRADAKLSLGFIRDVFDYIEYTPEHVLDHLLTVTRAVYSAEDSPVKSPSIHFAQVAESGKTLKREQLLDYRGFVKNYKSKVQVIPALETTGKRKQKISSLSSTSGRKPTGSTPGSAMASSSLKFLDIRAKGSKFIFVVDASSEMLLPISGGEQACAHIKKELRDVLSGLPPSALFNVILHDGKTVAAFRPEMIPVSKENLSGLQDWIEPALSSLSPNGLAPEQNTYRPQMIYPTALGGEAKGWVRAVQAAVEQHPDNIVVVGRDWGRNSLGRERAQRLVDFSMWQILGGSGDGSFAGSKVLLEDRKLRDNLVVTAVDAIADDEALREKEKKPPLFLHDFSDYMQYTTEQILDHLDVVCRVNDALVQQDPPRIHFVRLVSDDDEGVSDSSTRNINELVRVFKGEFRFLNGTEIRNSVLGKDATDEETAEELTRKSDTGGLPKSKFKFFGTEVDSPRIAFVLDVSEKMFADEFRGETTFEFIKRQIAAMIKSFDPGTQFNIIAYNEHRTVAFSRKMKSHCDPAELDAWLAAVQCGLTLTNLPPKQIVDVPATVYETAIGEDISRVQLAIQFAMEQRASTILVAGAGIGPLSVNREKARRLLNFSILNALGSQGSEASAADGSEDLNDGESSGMLAPLTEDQKQWLQVTKQTVSAIAAENKEREEAGLPLGFVRDIFGYIQYTSAHTFDHLLTVANACYPIENGDVELPQIHFVQLADDDPKAERSQLKEFKKFAKPYKSKIQLLVGAASEAEIRKLNHSMDLLGE